MFSLSLKKIKSENTVQRLLHCEQLWRQHAPGTAEVAHQAPSQETTLSMSASIHHSFNCVSICILAPLHIMLARYILRYQKSLKEVYLGGEVWECPQISHIMITASLLHKGFIRAPCFQTAGETCNTLELNQATFQFNG